MVFVLDERRRIFRIFLLLKRAFVRNHGIFIIIDRMITPIPLHCRLLYHLIILLAEQTAKLAGREWTLFLAAREQLAFPKRYADFETPGSNRPPGPKQAEQILRQFDLMVFLAFALNHPDDHLVAVDIPDL